MYIQIYILKNLDSLRTLSLLTDSEVSLGLIVHLITYVWWLGTLWTHHCESICTKYFSQRSFSQKGLGTCDALLCVPIHCRVYWRVGRRLGSCRLTSVQPLIGSTVWVFSISSALWVLEVLACLLTQFLSNRSQQLMVDGCRSKLVNVVSGVLQGSVFGPSMFLMYTSELFPFWKISWSVKLMTPLWWLLCHPQASELQ